jgi:Tfp pilus assembly protein PilV
MTLKRLQNTGDTIVEVLIALTVVTSILGGAYITSNRNLNNTRQSQERGEALKTAESQVERLKALVATGSTTPFTVTGNFCMDSNNTVQTAAVPNDRPDDFATYQAACVVQTAGPIYYAAISRASNQRFTVTIRWDKAGGGGHETLTMTYGVSTAGLQTEAVRYA